MHTFYLMNYVLVYNIKFLTNIKFGEFRCYQKDDREIIFGKFT